MLGLLQYIKVAFLSLSSIMEHLNEKFNNYILIDIGDEKSMTE